MSNLIPIESVNALQLFTIDGIDSLLKQIEDEVSDFEADVATVKGRQEIKSTAYKVTLSKGVIDTAGKDLVADWKKKAAVVDESRRKARAFLDDLSTKVRQPLTAWEQEQAAIEAAKRLVDQVAALHEEALAMNDLFDREREVQAREAELQKQQEAVEAQRKADEAKAEAARIAQERAKAEAERQARVQAEADAKAKLEAQEAIERERARATKAEQDAKDAAIQAEVAKQAAVEAERKRAEAEAAEREALRLRQERETQLAEQKRQADKENRRTVNTAALNALINGGVPSDIGKKVITLVAGGQVPGMTMVY